MFLQMSFGQKGVRLRAALASQFRVIVALVLRETRASYGTSQLGYLWEILRPLRQRYSWQFLPPLAVTHLLGRVSHYFLRQGF